MECQPVLPDDPVRQGDLIAAHPGTPEWRNPWTRFGVLLSADCDIARPKGPLVYLPIVGHGIYLRDVWLQTEAIRLETRARDELSGLLKKVSPALSTSHLSDWMEQGGKPLLVDKLKPVPEITEKQIDDLTERIGILVGLASFRKETDFDTDPQVALGELLRHKSAVERNKQAADRVVNAALASLPDRLDAWLLQDILGLDPDMREPNNFGFVVNLRSISVIEAERLETRKDSWYKDASKYLRACRLRGTYKTDLVQKFANLFTRVGLDDHRDQEHRRNFKTFSEKLFPPESI